MPCYLITATAAEQAESSSTTKSGEFLISTMYVHSEGKEALVFENIMHNKILLSRVYVCGAVLTL